MNKIFNIFSRKKEKVGNKLKKEKIIVDYREKNSLVASYLIKEGFDVEFKQLAIGDYIVKDVVIERKTVSDFKSSIVNKRIITQLLELKQFEKNLLILEGSLETGLYGGGIHENAFRGFLISVALDFDVPVIFTLDEKDSAKYISVLARRNDKGEISLRASKILLNPNEQAQFILEGFPNVGPSKSLKLLERFGSLKGIFSASEEELKGILGKRAIEFRKLLENPYLK